MCDSVYTDTIVIVVEDCCTIDPKGDIAITQMAGVTTFDVEVLEYFILNPESVIQVEGEYETYFMEMIICGELVQVELVQCFPKWADINGDGTIDGDDVEYLKFKVE